MFVGSLNMDPRSIKLNTELGLYFNDPEFAANLLNSLENGIDDCTYRLSATENGELAWHYDNPTAPTVQYFELGKRFSDEILMSVERLLGLEPQL